jgi:hypothetical protein
LKFPPQETETERKNRLKMRRKETVKARAEINEVERRKSTERNNKTQSLFFKKINEVDKSPIKDFSNTRTKMLTLKICSL